MTTKVNPNAKAIEWDEFLKLCESCGLTQEAEDDYKRFNFSLDGTRILEQVRPTKSGRLQKSGWFDHQFSSDTHWHDHKLTANGRVTILDSIDPVAPMIKVEQPAFVKLVTIVNEAKLI